MLRIKSLIIFFLALSLSLSAQHDGHDHESNQEHSEDTHDSHGESGTHHYGPGECMPLDAHHEFEVGEVAMHDFITANKLILVVPHRANRYDINITSNATVSPEDI